MFRIVIGSLVAGLVQFVVGAIAWVSPLGALAFKNLDDAQTAQVQAALASGLTATGTYFIPSPETAAGTALLGKGPVALIHFNTSGFPPMDATSLLAGFVMSVVTMLLVGTAVQRLPDFASRIRTTALFAVATILYFVLSLPVYNFYLPWDWWVFLGIQEFVAFGLGAFVLLRFFMPPAATPAFAPN